MFFAIAKPFQRNQRRRPTSSGTPPHARRHGQKDCTSWDIRCTRVPGSYSDRPTVLPRPCRPHRRDRPPPLPGQHTGPVLPTFSGSFGDWQHEKGDARRALAPTTPLPKNARKDGNLLDRATNRIETSNQTQAAFSTSAEAITAIIYPTPAAFPSDFFVKIHKRCAAQDVQFIPSVRSSLRPDERV